jgi:UDP-N-acetyl-D-mannosaminuronic acid dehydrogenase
MKSIDSLNVCVVGLGYIGLPTAALLASRGAYVHGVDVQPEVVDTINRGDIHIIEPDLDLLIREVIESKRLQASSTPIVSDVFMIAVPTPIKADNDKQHPSPCIDYVLDATRNIAPCIRNGNLIVLESTSPVGTTEKVAEVLTEEGVDVSQVHVAYCPERVLPGRIITELVDNDRIVGGLTPEATEEAQAFYRTFVKGAIHATDSRVAEMAKLTENAFRDVNIAFANELSMICDKLGIDVFELIQLTNCHPRVNVLTPGCGVGGHCIAVDPWFIVDSAPENARLIRTAREVNDYKSLWVIEKIKAEYRALDKEKPLVALCGLTFKPDIDDLRFSPAGKIVEALAKETDAEFLIVEPNIETHTSFQLTTYSVALDKADIVFKLVSHSAFDAEEEKRHSEKIFDFACR